MSHSFHKILIHAIWSTKNRAAFIWPEIEAAVYQFMKEQFTNQDCLPLIINGIPDHAHCLFFLNPRYRTIVSCGSNKLQVTYES